jgi:hypothetical protein
MCLKGLMKFHLIPVPNLYPGFINPVTEAQIFYRQKSGFVILPFCGKQGAVK